MKIDNFNFTRLLTSDGRVWLVGDETHAAKGRKFIEFFVIFREKGGRESSDQS
jgi:hypothetical protein